jgi:hypothetical protein
MVLTKIERCFFKTRLPQKIEQYILAYYII